MNIKTSNFPINHAQIDSEIAYTDIINQLVCTKKGRDLRNQNNDALTKSSLSKRERQFLLLLDSIDDISQKMCVSMAPKIRLKHMIELGLIASRVDKSKLLISLDQLNAQKLNTQKTTATNAQIDKNNKEPLTKTLKAGKSTHKSTTKDNPPTPTAIERANEQLARNLDKTKLDKNNNGINSSGINNSGTNNSGTESNIKGDTSGLSGIKNIKKRIGAFTNGRNKKISSSLNNLSNQKAKGSHQTSTKNTKDTPPPSIQVVAGVFID